MHFTFKINLSLDSHWHRGFILGEYWRKYFQSFRFCSANYLVIGHMWVWELLPKSHLSQIIKYIKEVFCRVATINVNHFLEMNLSIYLCILFPIIYSFPSLLSSKFFPILSSGSSTLCLLFHCYSKSTNLLWHQQNMAYQVAIRINISLYIKAGRTPQYKK